MLGRLQSEALCPRCELAHGREPDEAHPTLAPADHDPRLREATGPGRAPIALQLTLVATMSGQPTEEEKTQMAERRPRFSSRWSPPRVGKARRRTKLQ